MIGGDEFSIPDVVEPILGWRAWRLRLFAGDPADPFDVDLNRRHLPGLLVPEVDTLLAVDISVRRRRGVPTVPLLTSPMRTAVAWPPCRPWKGAVLSDGTTRDYLTARCTHGCTQVPSAARHESTPGCGFYAYKTIDALAYDFPMPGSRPAAGTWSYASMMVWGQIEMWGNVYEHERGYRAQHARVASLVHVDGASLVPLSLMRMAAEFYGVELTVLNSSIITEINRHLQWRCDHAHLMTEAFVDAVSPAAFVMSYAEKWVERATKVAKMATTYTERLRR